MPDSFLALIAKEVTTSLPKFIRESKARRATPWAYSPKFSELDLTDFDSLAASTPALVSRETGELLYLQ